MTSQEMFEATLIRKPGDDRPPMIDLTLPKDPAPSAAERASWKKA